MKNLKTAALIAAFLAAGLYAEPIKVHPDNPHYVKYSLHFIIQII